MHTLTFSVDGMRCRRCVRRTTALVRDVEGVHAVTADATSGLMTVLGTMTSADIAASLRNTTFTAHLIAEEPEPEFKSDAQRTSGTSATPPPDRGRTVVVATRFVLRQRRHTLPFLRAALASGREAQEVPGFLGGTVLADLWNRRFWTVSAWASPEAVRSYGSQPAHAAAMRRTEHWAAEARVERWRTHTFRVPSLVETAHRLGVPGPGRGLVRHLRPHPSVPAALTSRTEES